MGTHICPQGSKGDCPPAACPEQRAGRQARTQVRMRLLKPETGTFAGTFANSGRIGRFLAGFMIGRVD
jgi:hypothetical protein